MLLWLLLLLFFFGYGGWLFVAGCLLALRLAVVWALEHPNGFTLQFAPRHQRNKTGVFIHDGFIVVYRICPYTDITGEHGGNNRPSLNIILVKVGPS